MAGYSKTPLSKKIGIKEQTILLTFNSPENYLELLDPLPPKVQILAFNAEYRQAYIIHAFFTEFNELQTIFPQLLPVIKRNGMIWISWPKKSSKVPSDLSENRIRDFGLTLGIVDVKVAAISDIWSGLKFVITKKDR